MAKLLAVVWNVNTQSSAPKTTFQQKRNDVVAAMSNLDVRNFLQSLVNSGMTLDQAINYLAQMWFSDENQRDPFTGLAPGARGGILAAAVKAAANWAWAAGSPNLVFVAPE